MERSTVKVLVFVPLIALSMTTDWWSNTFKTVLLYPEMATGVIMLAALFAFGAPLAEYFSDGDKLVSGTAFFMILVSFAWSLLSGYGAVNQAESSHTDNFKQRQEWQKELDTTLSDSAIKDCRWKDRLCDSQAKKDRKAYIKEQLESGKYPRTQTKDRSDTFVGWALLMALSSVPIASFTFARILANAIPRNRSSTPKQGTQTVPSVPSLGTSETKRGTQKRMWDDKQHQKLENAWKKLEKEGTKITLDSLQKESGVSRSLCSLYKRGGGPQALPVKGRLLEFPKKD